MAEINSYPKVYNLGHRAIQGIFNDQVVVQEKVDGSQISFGVLNGGLCIRSKGQQLVVDAPEKMFARGVEVIKEMAWALMPNWVYRGEYLEKPKHNVLAYDRIPKDHIVLFDVDRGDQDFLDPAQLGDEAERMNLEVVPTIKVGVVESPDELKELLSTVSFLGGQKVEGVVVKAYGRFGTDGKTLMGKYVSEAFKEVHGGEWRKNNPAPQDVVDEIITAYRTPARWNKAIQHLTEAGQLEGSPRDIGLLIKEVAEDIKIEDGDDIRDRLFAYFWKKINRGVIAGLPEYYKELLMERAFDEQV